MMSLLMSLLINMGSSRLAMMSPLKSDMNNEFQTKTDASLIISTVMSLLLSYVSMMSLLVFSLISVS